MGATPGKITRPAPKLGEHTAQVAQGGGWPGREDPKG